MPSVHHRPIRSRSAMACCEILESRQLLATVAVNAGQTIRMVNDNFLGTNLAWWDPALPTTQTRDLVLAAGLTSFRFPGGSSSDEFHFAKPPEWNGKGTAATFAKMIESVGGEGMVTLNYGTGSPQEAAAFLAYLNAPTTSTVAIGMGQQWDDTTSTWIQKNWQNAGYWANIRASAPLAVDDGLNFLRISHPASFDFRYFEVGNEVHGSWETDRHGSGGDTGAPHDPATYINFAKQVHNLAQQIDPAAVVSIVVDGTNSWTTNVLNQCVAQGYTPSAISDHTYMQGPGNESDNFLLMNTVSNPASGFHWPTKATNLRNALIARFGTATGNAIEMLQTEYNSVYSNPGKQTTSLVNGLFIADSVGSLLRSDYDGGWMWDLRNGWDTSNNNSPNLYGWRQGGDYGLLGSGTGLAPATGFYVPYPTYFAMQLASKLASPSATLVTASSNDPYLSVYAATQPNGHLSLFVINKHPANNLSATFNLSGYSADPSATFWQYGKAEDTAQSQTTDGHSSLTTWTTTLSFSGSSFSQSFPSYSMSIIDLQPPISQLPPTDIALFPAMVAENQPAGTLVGSFATTDPDAGDSFTYSLVSGPGSTDNTLFSLAGSQLRTAAIFNYETQGSYSIRVRSTDAAGIWTEKVLSVSVINLNEPPASLTLSSGSLPENQPAGTAIGVLAAADPDAGTTLSYSLLAGQADNAFFSLSGTTLLSALSFDAETQSSYSIRVRASDQSGLWTEKLFLISVQDLPEASVTGRQLFYNHSSFDGNNAAATAADDGAIASDKQALLPGQSATFANYSSYSRGLNGLLLDLAGFTGTLAAADFLFRVGNSSTPGTWATAPAPVSLTQRTLPNGHTRVTLLWADNAIQKQWLQVTVLGNGNTDLASNDVFYFGNAIGESGNSAADAQVTTADEALTRNNQSGLATVPITNWYDFNRDGRVNSQDVAITRGNKSGLTPLLLITPPVSGTSTARTPRPTAPLQQQQAAAPELKPLARWSQSLLFPEQPLLA